MDVDYSEIKDILIGVPQGSMLDPVLFSMYIYEISVTPPVDLVMWTDNTAIYMTHRKKDIAVEQIQQSILTIDSWYDKWLSKWNTGKFKTVLISKGGNKPPDKNVTDCNQRIDWVKD